MADLSALDWLTFHVSTRTDVEDGEVGPDVWSLTASVPPDDDTDDQVKILWMDGWTLSLGTGHNLEAELDNESTDSSVFIPLIDGDDLAEDVEVDGFGSRLVLLNRVRLDPAWRGHGGVGRYLTGMAIRRLDAGAACAALHASPFELKAKYSGKVPGDVWEAGATALHAVWESLGFRQYEGHIFVLDPTLRILDDAIEDFRARLRP